jgi:hypothetical protein
MTTCKNCSEHFDSKYCPFCGTASEIIRIDKHYVLHELQHGILHFEKGFLYTVRELITNPGNSIRNFINGERSKHYKPIGFLIICSIIYSILAKILKHKVKADSPIGNVNRIIIWITENYNYSNLIEIVFIALSLKWFFSKKEVNYFENIVLLCFLTGIGMLINSVSLVFEFITRTSLITKFFQIITIAYTVWAIGQFYDKHKWTTYLKALLAYILGFVLFIASALIFAITLKVLKIHL